LIPYKTWSKITKIFGPEHGFRGTANAGDKVENAVDAKSGIPVISLYGKKRKPSAEDLADVDVLLFDIQDVGCSFLYLHFFVAGVYGKCNGALQTTHHSRPSKS
jgi:uncharacterized protein YbbC (DUF1343 family)